MRQESRVARDYLTLDDLRDRRAYHLLHDIVWVAVCAAKDSNKPKSWQDVEAFAYDGYRRLRQSLSLPNGVPSHKTFRDVFSYLSIPHLKTRFSSWTRAAEQIVVWTSPDRLVLGNTKRSADHPARAIGVEQLLKPMDIEGCTVILDLGGSQALVASQVIAQGADYALAITNDQRRLCSEIQNLFACCEGFDEQVTERGHSWNETRSYKICARDKCLPRIPSLAGWEGFESLVMLQSELHRGTVFEEPEIGYFVTSLGQTGLTNLRVHRGDSSSLHWVLDIVPKEGTDRDRPGAEMAKLASLGRFNVRLPERPNLTEIPNPLVPPRRTVSAVPSLA